MATTIRNNKVRNYLVEVQDSLLLVQKQRSAFISQISSDKFAYTEELTYKSMDFRKSINDMKKIANVSFRDCQRLQVLIKSMGNSYLKFNNKFHNGVYCNELSDISIGLDFCHDGDNIYRNVKEKMAKLAKQYDIKLK